MKKPANFKWSKEKCQEEALKYNHKIDFKRKSKGAYSAALMNGWKDEICSHMIPLGNKNKRMIYRFVFPDNYCYIGLTCDPDRRKKEHFTKIDSGVYLHIKETNLIPIYEELTEYLDVIEAKSQEKYWKNKSEEEGLICLNKAKTGAVGGNIIKWNKEKCKEEALKYTTKTIFRKNCSSAYESAYKNKWLDEICSHMIGYNKWNKEKCKEEALKYTTRYSFFIGSNGSWNSARRNHWLDEICSHMIEVRKKKGYWILENCIIEAKKYKRPIELKNSNSRAYKIICNNNLIDVIYSKNN